MNVVLLADFLLRVQKAGGNLTGCEIRKDGMDHPHVFQYFKDGLVCVKPDGNGYPANLIKWLKVIAIDSSAKRRSILGKPQKLLIEFEYV